MRAYVIAALTVAAVSPGFVLLQGLEGPLAWVLGAVVAGVAALGAELSEPAEPGDAARGAPGMGSLARGGVAAGVAAAALLVLRLPQAQRMGLVAPAAAIGALALIMLARLIGRAAGQRGGVAAHLVDTAAAYVSAFVLFGALSTLAWAWMVALGSGAVALALSPPLFMGRAVALSWRRAALNWLVVGIGSGELGWAMTLLHLPAPVAGGLMVLVFHLLAGVSRAELSGALNRKLALEYAALSAITISALIAYLALT